jgi:uroporphyrinogen decarboxylase
MIRMTSKERVLTAFAHREPDRVPINYMANPGIDARLKQHFGLAADDAEGLRRALGVDFRPAGGCSYQGPLLHAPLPGGDIRVDGLWGIRTRWVEHPAGGYWDYCDFPLQDATEEEVARWPFPSPDDFDYSGVAESCRQLADYAIYVGSPGLGDIINTNGMLRGMEQTFIDLATDDPAGLLLARRRTENTVEINRRVLEAAKGGVDFLWMGEDLGTQIGPIISLETYRTHIRPLHQQIVDLAKAFEIPVMIHCCGSSSWAFEEFIAMGIRVVDTLQPEAKDMAPAYLKGRFGGRLAFHGCISTAGPVATGTVDEVRAYCRETLAIMAPGGGYCFAPTHMLQDNSPTENVVAMYEEAREWTGRNQQ